MCVLIEKKTLTIINFQMLKQYGWPSVTANQSHVLVSDRWADRRQRPGQRSLPRIGSGRLMSEES